MQSLWHRHHHYHYHYNNHHNNNNYYYHHNHHYSHWLKLFLSTITSKSRMKISLDMENCKSVYTKIKILFYIQVFY
jgi:hypothetical protein